MVNTRYFIWNLFKPTSSLYLKNDYLVKKQAENKSDQSN